MRRKITTSYCTYAALAVLIFYISFTVVNLYNYDAKISEKISVLNSTLSSIEQRTQADYKQIASSQIIINNNLTIISKQIKDLQADIRKLRNELQEEHKHNKELEKSLEIIKKSKGLINPTYKQLKQFILADNTDSYEWSKDFDCTEFSYTFIENLAKKGYYSCSAELDLFTDGKDIGHIIVAVKTDKGIYYVEPQTDKVISTELLIIGKNYCDIVDWDCDWEITKISSCFELKL